MFGGANVSHMRLTVQLTRSDLYWIIYIIKIAESMFTTSHRYVESSASVKSNIAELKQNIHEINIMPTLWFRCGMHYCETCQKCKEHSEDGRVYWMLSIVDYTIKFEWNIIQTLGAIAILENCGQLWTGEDGQTGMTKAHLTFDQMI